MSNEDSLKKIGNVRCRGGTQRAGSSKHSKKGRESQVGSVQSIQEECYEVSQYTPVVKEKRQ